MAKRRMFSLDVVDTDSFLDLPASSQSLYFHLGMRADDDGFVSSPKRITAMVGAAGDDLKLLIAKGFVIPFESGVCVIRDWRVNNYIQRDRYTPSIYTEEKQRLHFGAHTWESGVLIRSCARMHSSVLIREHLLSEKLTFALDGHGSAYEQHLSDRRLHDRVESIISVHSVTSMLCISSLTDTPDRSATKEKRVPR